MDDVHQERDTYGADAGRLFMMSDSPPERDLEWTEAGIEGAWRYLNRLWRMIADPDAPLAAAGAAAPENLDEAAESMLRAVHQTVAAVTEGLERFRFNRAVAHVRELTNLLGDYTDAGPAHDGDKVPHRQGHTHTEHHQAQQRHDQRFGRQKRCREAVRQNRPADRQYRKPALQAHNLHKKPENPRLRPESARPSRPNLPFFDTYS